MFDSREVVVTRLDALRYQSVRLHPCVHEVDADVAETRLRRMDEMLGTPSEP